jgi:2Fe-2S ferredoxin
MARITFQQPNGYERTVDISDGLSIMEGAVQNMVPGIDADCGGACACATCMIYIPDEWSDRLPPKDATEEALLQFSPRADERSRLSCQIKVSDALDGMLVTTPVHQH